MAEIDLGFLENSESWSLESRFFPSKVGGKPAWLNLKDLPGVDDVKCKNCASPCSFLCQVYADIPDKENCFHRTLFVFICKNGGCCKANDNGNLRVLRSQLPRKNSFYPFEAPEPDEHWRPDIQASKYTKICQVCSLKALNHCGKCKMVNYCCRDHQICDWKAGHKDTCGVNKNASYDSCNSKNHRVLFPEFDLLKVRTTRPTKIEEREELEKETEEKAKYEQLVESGCAGTLQFDKDADKDLLDMAASEEDETFTDFQSTIRDDPDQVLRYDRGGDPLYISSQNQPTAIPKCEACGSERQFEFQIMPQLLNDLDVTDDPNGLDWGILAVFTCKNSCEPTRGYIPEYIWKQDIV